MEWTTASRPASTGGGNTASIQESPYQRPYTKRCCVRSRLASFGHGAARDQAFEVLGLLMRGEGCPVAEHLVEEELSGLVSDWWIWNAFTPGLRWGSGRTAQDAAG